MAVDRVAQRRARTDQILALDPPRGHYFASSDLLHQAALADRARLSGAQARGRARAFRRPRMARLSSSRHAVHRRLRIPGLREGDDSPSGSRPARPFKTPAVPNGYRPRGSAAANPTTRPELDCDNATTPNRRSRQNITEMPMLRSSNAKKSTPKFVTQ